MNKKVLKLNKFEQEMLDMNKIVLLAEGKEQ